MERIPLYPPYVVALQDVESRPLWSVMIPVYNCIKFIPDVLSSVLEQCLPEHVMQIEVVDDASTDGNVEALVRKIGNGRIKYFRQPENVGSLRNFHTCIIRSRGKLVHLLHGDDRVRLGFYDKFTGLFNQYPQAGAAFCRFRNIDQDGQVIDDAVLESTDDGILEVWLCKIAVKQTIQYASIVVKREVYEKLGSFYGMTYAEDWEMWVRIAKHYPVAYTPDNLAEYRSHPGSISKPKVNNGQISRDVVTAIKMITAHLPAEKRHVMRKVEKGTALFCLMHANMIWRETKSRALAKSHVKLALSFRQIDILILTHNQIFNKARIESALIAINNSISNKSVHTRRLKLPDQ